MSLGSVRAPLPTCPVCVCVCVCVCARARAHNAQVRESKREGRKREGERECVRED
jgi:hypothetical protein